MTDFTISAETFLRLSKIALQPDETHHKYDAVLRSVRIECTTGRIVAIATCGKLVVVENLGDNPNEVDGAVNITIDERMLAIAEAEKQQSGLLSIQQVPGWTMVRGTETGKMFPLNGEIVGEYPDWRALIPFKQPTKNNGAVSFSGHQIGRMGEAAPSGCFTLPKFVDYKQPVIINDTQDPNWIGMFLVSDKGNPERPADVPEWLI